jgi:microcystin-dependent protein
MSDQYLGEIRMTGFNYAPQGWALCNGQALSISANNALFALLGTTYGGNGTTNFNLPNLQCRGPIHWGNSTGLSPTVIGEIGGTESVTLLATNLPIHNHMVAPPVSNAAATANTPVNGYMAVDAVAATPPIERTTIASKSYAATSVAGQTAAAYPTAMTGGSLPVDISPPYLAVTFIIALTGIFPPRP